VHSFGTDPVHDVAVTDFLPAGVSYVTSTGIVTPKVDGNRVVWQLGTVDGQDSSGFGDLYLTVRVDSGVPLDTQLVNRVEIATTDQESGMGNNQDTNTVTVQAGQTVLWIE
jgi:hypothetical protein